MNSKNLFLVFGILTTCMSAQVISVKDNTIDIGALQLEGVNKINNDEAEGSPYVDDSYVPAKINAIEKTHFVRLNASNQTLEVKISTTKIIVLEAKNDFVIQFLDGSNRRFITISYADEDANQIRSFFEVITENKDYVLYRRERKKFVKARKTSTYLDKAPARYVDLEPIFYVSSIADQSTTLIEIPQKKNNFFSLFKENSKKVSQFAKEEKLSISEPKDVIEILNFYFKIKK